MGKSITPPAQTEARLKALGQRIRLARLRRGLSAASLAQSAGINRDTLSALELGRPGVALGTTAAVLWVLGLDGALDQLADPDADVHGKALEAMRRPRRARASVVKKNEYDF